ncbi:FlgO family outer membrane protein [Aliagarivorans marinus]|uniref:FlgO family outer membrane protein n=1 Tax=Aliagarivorans marinus TaxID=561965 RepID=UPI000414C6E2|nr:FlgO family outer membrane protein [Aliagarivorans marinus]
MKAITITAASALLLLGCSSSEQQSQTPEVEPSSVQTVKVYDPMRAASDHNANYREAVVGSDGALYILGTAPPKPVDQDSATLLDYVSDLSFNLVSSSHYVNRDTAIGVASFVELDNYHATDNFGLQLAESFVYEMQQYGFSVIDYKSTGYIRVTDNGDFVYSRKVSELQKRLPIEYLLIGTYTNTQHGVVVNARIVGAQSKVVVASAQTLVPHSVYRSSEPMTTPARKDGVLLLGNLSE